MWYHISSIVLYGATLIVASVEMGYSVQFYNETCTEIFETQYCWPFFVVAWALAITASALSLLRDMVLQIRHRRLRRQVQPQPAGTMRTALIVIGSAGLVAVLWLVTIVVGWVQPQLPEEAQLPSWDWFGQSVDSGDWYSDESSQLPATGMFQWSVDYSNAVNAYQQSSYSNLWPLPSWVTDPAHAGLAAVVLCTMSFAWSILEVILEFVYVWPKSATSSPGQDYREATYKQTLAKDASTRYLEITGNSSSYT